MKIVRGGVTYELTPGELIQAFLEQEHKFDVAFVCEYLGSEDEFQRLAESERWPIYDEMAYTMRGIADKDGISDYDALERARKEYEIPG